MRLKAWIVCIFVLGVTTAAGCVEPSGGTSGQEPQASDGPATHPPIDDTPGSTVTAQLPTSSPEPSPTEMPVFKLPEANEPGWLIVSSHELGGSIRIAFTADGKTLAVSAGKPRIDFYDVKSGEVVNTLSYSAPVGIMDFALTPDGSELVVASQGRIDVWDIAAKTFRILTHVPRDKQWGTYLSIDLSPDGAFLAAGPTPDSSLETSSKMGRTWRVTYADIWETETWTRKRVLRDAIPVFSFSPDGKLLATLSGGGMEAFDVSAPVVIWDMTTGTRHELAVEGFPDRLDYAPDGVTLAINTQELVADQPKGVQGTLLLDTTTGRVQRTLTNQNPVTPSPGLYRNSHIPVDLRFSPDGELVAVLYGTGVFAGDQIVLWNVETGEQALVLNAVEKFYQPTFSPDGTLLAAVSTDGRILFWNVPDD